MQSGRTVPSTSVAHSQLWQRSGRAVCATRRPNTVSRRFRSFTRNLPVLGCGDSFDEEKMAPEGRECREMGVLHAGDSEGEGGGDRGKPVGN